MASDDRDERSRSGANTPANQTPANQTGATNTHGATASRSDVLHDRRRPGRLRNPNPALIPLMRGQSINPPKDDISPPNIRTLPDDYAAAFAPEPDTHDVLHDDLRAARGIITGLALSILLWGVLIGGSWLAYTLL